MKRGPFVLFLAIAAGALVLLVLSVVLPSCSSGSSSTTSSAPATAATSQNGGSADSSSTTVSSPPTSMGAPGVTRGWTSLNPYTVIVGSVPTGFSGARGQADAIAGRLAKVGLPAGVLLSSDYPSLASGYWVVYSGDFAQTTQAGVHQDNVRASGFTDAHVAEVSDTPTLRPTTLADLNGKTYLPVFFLVPGVVSHIEFRSDPSDPKGLQWYTFRAVSQGHLFWVTVAPSNFFEFSEENAPDPAHYTDITMRYPLLTGTLVRVFIYSAKAPPTAIQDFAQALARELVIKG